MFIRSTKKMDMLSTGLGTLRLVGRGGWLPSPDLLRSDAITFCFYWIFSPTETENHITQYFSQFCWSFYENSVKYFSKSPYHKNYLLVYLLTMLHGKNIIIKLFFGSKSYILFFQFKLLNKSCRPFIQPEFTYM